MDPQASDVLGRAAYDGFFEHSSLPTMAIDHERRAIIRANLAALELLGLDASQVLGRPGTDFLVEPSPDELLRIRSLRGDETAAIRQVPTAFGFRTVELNIVPSGIEGVAFLQAIDLTDLLEAAARAEARAEELASTSTALKTIAARLAHDLRSPMVAIAGFADVLLHDHAELDEEQRANALERISANIRALEAMTASILSEADTGRTRPEDSSYEVDDLFRTLRAVTEAQLADGGGTLETAAMVTTLPVPVGTIRQALVNLVSNSIKYRDRSRSLRIEVGVRPADGGTAIVVRDNGKGLPEDPTELFEAGTRGPAAEGTTGAGLGLAFVRAEVESVGGSVTARALQAGAEFVIVLPAPADADTTQQRPAGGALSTGLSAPQLERVMDASPVATIVIDIVIRQIVRVNRASIKLLGFDEEDIVGRPGSDFVDERAIADALRRLVIEEPNARHMVRTYVRTARGALPATVWIAAVEGTSLAVAQVIERDGPPSATPPGSSPAPAA